ncbi:glycoside hydrolase family 15 protein [Roseiarcus sp.]|uniref:glycoside hydrolase family 15 protein n=1 Tax=Roseiarcus sp. TaxID=1969460 RepID=UPI003F9707F1
MTGLDAWIEEQASLSAREMLRAISATDTIKERPGFGQRVVPLPGSVLASPVLAAYDPDPDYFFHWFRDSAIVIDALRVALAEGWLKSEALDRFREFVRFNQSLSRLDGREFLVRSNFRKKVQPSFLQYLRADAEIAPVREDAVQAEVRVNPDGTLDFTRWSRPQNDGGPLRALALLRWRVQPGLDEGLREALRELIVADIDFTLARVNQPSFDIWEEERGFHYYTQLVQAEALGRGGAWLAESGDAARARACRAAAQQIISRLDALWDPKSSCYRSRTSIANGDPRKTLDIAVVLATLHAQRASGTHSVLDPRAQATLAALEDLFDAEYDINRRRPDGRGPAMGRYSGDAYYSGGAYYFSTLAAGQFYFKLAAALHSGAEFPATDENTRFLMRLGIGLEGAKGAAPADAAFARGDAFMRTVRAFTPASRELSEQFDRTTGAQTSAKRLTWSYAAFITAAASRREACVAMRASRPYGTRAGTA